MKKFYVTTIRTLYFIAVRIAVNQRRKRMEDNMTTEEQIQVIEQWQDELVEIAWDYMLREEEES